MIAVSPRQQGNPVLKHIRNVPYQITEGITPDYGTLVMYGVCVGARDGCIPR